MPGARFVDVARRHEVSRSLLWSVARPGSARRSAGRTGTAFVPLRVAEIRRTGRSRRQRAPRSTPPGRTASAGEGRIEIALPDGTVVRVGEGIGSAALRRVLAALRA